MGHRATSSGEVMTRPSDKLAEAAKAAAAGDCVNARRGHRFRVHPGLVGQLAGSHTPIVNPGPNYEVKKRLPRASAASRTRRPRFMLGIDPTLRRLDHSGA